MGSRFQKATVTAGLALELEGTQGLPYILHLYKPPWRTPSPGSVGGGVRGLGGLLGVSAPNRK